MTAPKKTHNFVFGFLTASLLLGAGACQKKAAEPAPVAKAQSVRIGIQPNEKTKDLNLFRDELARRIGMNVEVKIPQDYADMMRAFSGGEMDFAFFSPLMVVQAEREAG